MTREGRDEFFQMLNDYEKNQLAIIEEKLYEDNLNIECYLQKAEFLIRIGKKDEANLVYSDLLKVLDSFIESYS